MMTPFEREELKRRAEAKLAAMRERAMRLRRRVLTGAAIAFVVLWVAIFAQMITGNDPALEPIAANVRSTSGESTASEPELRLSSTEDQGDDDEEGDEEDEAEEGETWSEGGSSAAEQAEAEAAEAAEAEELAPATTGQS
jgi:cytoskeletal protein RodZ